MLARFWIPLSVIGAILLFLIVHWNWERIVKLFKKDGK
jgi:putative effector of murein hydrolase LrgA (UPF0299 family)